MSKPAKKTDAEIALEFMPFEQLIEELKKRTRCCLVVYEAPSKMKGSEIVTVVRHAGSICEIKGMAAYAKEWVDATFSVERHLYCEDDDAG